MRADRELFAAMDCPWLLLVHGLYAGFVGALLDLLRIPHQKLGEDHVLGGRVDFPLAGDLVLEFSFSELLVGSA